MNYKYDLPVVFDGFTTSIVVNVSAYILDATQALWALYDLNGNEVVGAVAPTSSTSVTITVSPAPPAGSYPLVGIQ